MFLSYTRIALAPHSRCGAMKKYISLPTKNYIHHRTGRIPPLREPTTHRILNKRRSDPPGRREVRLQDPDFEDPYLHEFTIDFVERGVIRKLSSRAFHRATYFEFSLSGCRDTALRTQKGFPLQETHLERRHDEIQEGRQGTTIYSHGRSNLCGSLHWNAGPHLRLQARNIHRHRSV